MSVFIIPLWAVTFKTHPSNIGVELKVDQPDLEAVIRTLVASGVKSMSLKENPPFNQTQALS
jgi:hypothetical protein